MYFTTSAPNFLWGGCFQFFTKNRPQKHRKRAILHTSQANGGLEPPHSPLATLLCFSQPEFWAFILKILVFGIYLLSEVELNQTEIYFVNCYR